LDNLKGGNQVAVIHGDKRAGQFAKRKAFDHTMRIIMTYGILAIVIGTVFGVLIGLSLAEHFSWARRVAAMPIWAILALEITAYASLQWLLRWIEEPVNELVRRRLNWLRGGQMEGLVAMYLNELPDDWHVFHNVQLQKEFDLDHVIIGPTGMFCLSTKSNRGIYTVRPDGMYELNGKETDHVHEAQRLALKLKDRMVDSLGEVPWIQPVLMAPLAYVGFNTWQKCAWVVHEDNLPEVFTEARGTLKSAEVNRCAMIVEEIVNGAKAL
jgi:hypothetical protein